MERAPFVYCIIDDGRFIELTDITQFLCLYHSGIWGVETANRKEKYYQGWAVRNSVRIRIKKASHIGT